MNDCEDFGPMPTLEEFLLLRGEKCDNYAYSYLLQLFGPCVYGENMHKTVIDFNFGDHTEQQGKEHCEKALKLFTSSDEAFILTILVDCWDVWTHMGKTTFKAKLFELNPRWYNENGVDQMIDTSSARYPRFKYSGSWNSSRCMNEDGMDYFEDMEEKIAREDRAGDRGIWFMMFLNGQYRSRMGYADDDAVTRPSKRPRKRSWQ